MNKLRLRNILRKALNESRASFGNTPIETFNPDAYPGAGYTDILESILYIMDELSDGLVRLMDPTEYENMLATMEDMAIDGDEDIAYYLPKLSAVKQGQYVRISLR